MKSEDIFDISNKREELKKLREKSAKPDFWDEPKKAQRINKKIANIADQIQNYKKLQSQLDDLQVMLELAIEEETEELTEEIETELNRLNRMIEKIEFNLMLSGEHDDANAILLIHSGAGGTEACDWASMLMRMYLRWAESHNYKIDLLEKTPGDEAGIKSATILVSGRYAYGYLKAESGVHRLVRLSPFDSNHRRHTSFASVSVSPEIEDDIDIDIEPSELRVDTYRASGPGGQHVNTTDSAVRMTHRPTGIVVQCQSERSQHRNRDMAMKVLRSRLYEYLQKKQEEEISKLQGEKQDIDFGSQIRSYVLHPYRRVKDLRTDVETGKVDDVMDGDIDMFIEAYLKQEIGE